jgi:hypothetical protein
MNTDNCPRCAKANSPNVRFCQHCGLALTEAPLSTGDVARPAVVAPPTDLTSAEAKPRATQEPQAIGQMGAGGFSVADIWGPFAGYGERGRHVSWLLDDLGDRAEDLREAVTHRFRERQIPRAAVQPKTLTGRGVAVERRPYHLIRRGVATAGLYIARFGQDLFISQVTYARGAINPLRVLILALMVLFQAYLVFGYGGSLQSAVDRFDPLRGSWGVSLDRLGFLLCCVGPFGILNTLGLALAGLHMAYKFITDRDPLMLLRTPPNEFQQDDIIALEKAVEETVRQSLDTIGIDTALMPPAPEYGVKRRLI